jgi:hypothetical protein
MKQIDFRNAFVQSNLPAPMYLELPQGFEETGKVFKVEKSLYRDKRAPKLWFKHLRDNMTCPQLAFTPSEADPCLFVKDGIAFITYVDNGIFVAKSEGLIDDTIALLRQRGLDLDEEDDYAGYLGIDLKQQLDWSKQGSSNRLLLAWIFRRAPKPRQPHLLEPLDHAKTLIPFVSHGMTNW